MPSKPMEDAEIEHHEKTRGRLILKNPKAELFCQLRGSQGRTWTDCYIIAFRPKLKTKKVCGDKAWRFAARPKVAARILYLEHRMVEDRLKQVRTDDVRIGEVIRNARYGITRAINTDNLGQLNGHNRTLSELAGHFKVQVNHHTVIIDERLDAYGYDDEDEESGK